MKSARLTLLANVLTGAALLLVLGVAGSADTHPLTPVHLALLLLALALAVAGQRCRAVADAGVPVEVHA